MSDENRNNNAAQNIPPGYYVDDEPVIYTTMMGGEEGDIDFAPPPPINNDPVTTLAGGEEGDVGVTPPVTNWPGIEHPVDVTTMAGGEEGDTGYPIKPPTTMVDNEDGSMGGYLPDHGDNPGGLDGGDDNSIVGNSTVEPNGGETNWPGIEHPPIATTLAGGEEGEIIVDPPEWIDPPEVTTLAGGEEGESIDVPEELFPVDPITTMAGGEEGEPIDTTQALGETGEPPPLATTMAVGEEGEPIDTTQALGETGEPPPLATTMAVGEEGEPIDTTQALGETGEPPPIATTLAVGEEGDFEVTTQAGGEEGDIEDFDWECIMPVPPTDPKSYEKFTEFLVGQVNNLLPELYADIKLALYNEHGQDMYENYNQLFTDYVLQNYEHIYTEIKADFYDVGEPPVVVCDIPLPVEDIIDLNDQDNEIDLLLGAIGEGTESHVAVNNQTEVQGALAVDTHQDVLEVPVHTDFV